MPDKFWKKLPIETLEIVYRIAKNKGLRPFFADPHEMIALRDHVSEQRLSK